MRIGENLDLDVPRPLDELLEVHGVVAERALRFPSRRVERALQLLRRRYDAHSLAAASGRRLEQYRIAELLRDLRRLFCVGQRLGSPGHHGYSVRDRECPRRGLAAHRRDRFGGRADPDESRVTHRSREPFPLGQKSVAGMNGFGASQLCGFYDLVAAQIALARGRRADEHGFVRLAHVRRPHVGFAVDSHRLYSELLARPDHTQRDLAAIRNQDFLKHL